MSTDVFVTGGTGYLGRRLIPELVTRGHAVRVLVRPGSEHKVPRGATPVVGNVLARDSIAPLIRAGDVVVHLVGTPRPSPAKAAEFEAVDYISGRECIAAAAQAGARHFVYVSVAHPAPLMQAYIDVRIRVESLLRASGLPHTIVRPWYVLGPGHRWPYLLVPAYWVLERLPSTRDSARRLGLVTLRQMIATLARAVDEAGPASRTIDVAEIRATV